MMCVCSATQHPAADMSSLIKVLGGEEHENHGQRVFLEDEEQSTSSCSYAVFGREEVRRC